jgi:predicted 2-oxoglutarate/Fe(II)-dependent dioxygenase YbiX
MLDMKKDLTDYILHTNNFIDKNVCEQTIKEIQNISFEEHKFHNPKTNEYAPKSKDELSMSWDNIPTKKIIMQKLWYAIANYLEIINFPWFNHWQGYSDIRFNKYNQTKKMALHCDHIHSLFDGEKKGIPILSVLGVLNDDYEGGEFIMFDNYEIKFKQGDLIIFPSNFLYPHKVEPVTKGTRYSYISWVW